MTASHDDLLALARRSAEVILEHQHPGGAYPASPTYSVYGYCWFRDGSFIADAISRCGFRDSAEAFFGWCARVITERADEVDRLVARASAGEVVPREDHLPTRYTLQGGLSTEQWWDFQLDGYGAWLWALTEHAARYGTSLNRYRDAASLTASYLCAFWDQPCFDWWEEHPDDVHPSTLGAIHGGLASAIQSKVLEGPLAVKAAGVCRSIETLLTDRAVVDGHLVKSLGRTDVDASLIACVTPFAAVAPRTPIAEATYDVIVHDLAPDGVYRYLADTFYGGGRWVVLAGLLGWHEAVTGRAEVALDRLRWMHAQATPEGFLPEQVPTHALDRSFIPQWETKWGPIATPLLWSHAMYLTLANALGIAGDLSS